MPSPTVPGVTPAAVLAAAVTGGSGAPVQAVFSTTGLPDLPSNITEVVWMPTNATIQSNMTILGILQSLGWATGNITTVTAAYTVLSTDAIIEASATGGPFTVTLPDATQPGFVTGQRYTVVKTDGSANLVTVAGSAGQLINGAASVTLNAQYANTSVAFDGTNWIIWGGVTQGSTPAGPAGGDLAGNYPNPTVPAADLALRMIAV